MPRTLNQRMADAHEADIAEWTQGALQKGSGNQWQNQGDTKNGEFLVPFPITSDGKSTLARSVSVTRAMWSKIVSQTFNQIPAIFLRFYKDDTLRQADLDLVVMEAQTFAEILRAARKWEELKELAEHPAVLVDGKHLYLSTGCLHGNHAYCQNKEGQAGPKEAGECKHCSAPCLCPCHGERTGCECCR